MATLDTVLAAATEGFRVAQIDISNQDKLLSVNGDVTLDRPDGTKLTGPSWLKLVSSQITLTNGAVAVNIGGTGATNAEQGLKNLQGYYFRAGAGLSEDLNTLLGDKAGLYYQPTNAGATTANNYPYPSAGAFQSIKTGGGRADACIHKYYPYNGLSPYQRMYNGTFGEWRQYILDGDFGIGTKWDTSPVDGVSGFISTSDATKVWAPANGAGTQSAYQTARAFQTWIDSANGFYVRFATSAQANKTTTPWVKLQAAGVSDENWKTIKADLDVEFSLNNINQMEFKRFVYIDDESQSERRGVIAQQIEQIDPQYVHSEDKSGRYTLDLNPLVLDALAAIKALCDRDVENKARIETLETELSDLKELVTSLSSNLHPQL